jgi:GTP-binding protein
MKKINIRNVAIIAHVDHGKTTIVDSLLKFSGQFIIKNNEAQDMVLDSNPLERERGITILSKCASINYGENTINIVDTPGHADFGSEVERVLKMVDGAILMIDSVDGPMPQTRFVLQKALTLGLRPIVVINKMDRSDAIPNKVIDNVFDLFIKLGATNEQLDFPIVYASGRDGWASTIADKKGKDIEPIITTILSHVSPPPEENIEKPLQMQITMLYHNNFLGNVGVGRISNGIVKKDQTIALVNDSNSNSPKITKVIRIDKFYGLGKQEVELARAGDIVSISGLEGIKVGDTVCNINNILPLPKLLIDEPTVSMNFLVNDSPFAGQEGKFLTGRHIKARLEKEIQTNVGLKVEALKEDGTFKVSGRGDLHLTILIETMRREGFEFSVSSPEVIYKEKDGKIYEPMEYLILNIENQYQGVIFELLGKRAAKLENMVSENENRVRFEYIIPSRTLTGFKNEFLTNTRGQGILHHSFYKYMPKVNLSYLRTNGVLIAKERGKTTAYALENLQISGQLFVNPKVEVYEGMIIGKHARENDLIVNPCKLKKLSNMRSKNSDNAPILTPPILMNIEKAIGYIAPDELVEITPISIRLRKKELNHVLRKRSSKNEAEK